MSKSRKSHIRKLYDLRFDFKYVLANIFFTNPEAFLSCFYNKTLDGLLKNIWSNYVKSENYNPEIYTAEFDVTYPSLDSGDEVFIAFNMPDILDVNNPEIEYSWHASVGVSYFLYYNLNNRNTKYYVCESSIKSTMDMAMMEGKYVPVYFVVELDGNGRRNIGQIASHSIEEVRNSFYNAVLSDLRRTVQVENLKQQEHSAHSELWNAILNKAPYEEIKRLVEAGADLYEEGNEKDIIDGDFYDIINVVFDHPDSYEITKLFVKHGYNAKKMLKNGLNVVTESIFSNDPRIFFYIYNNIDQNVMLQINDNNGKVNVLNVAAFSNEKPDIIKFLIDKGAPIDSVNEYGWGIVHNAVQNPNSEILQMLVDNGVAVDNKDYKELKPFQPLDYSIINDPNNYKFITPLALAAFSESPEACEILIKAGAKLEAKDKLGCTPLMLATRNKNPDVFRLLLKYGANINALDYMKEGVLNHALRYSPLELVVEIAERTKAHFHDYNYKIYINNIEKMNKTRELARKDPDFLNMLLSVGIDPDLPKEKKLPYIFLAAENPDLRVLDFLSEKGCDLSLGTYEENVASHVLENNSNPSAIDYLISRKLLPNNNSFISEHIVKNPNVEVWKKLRDIGFPLNHQDEDGISLLMKVFYQNSEPDIDVVKFLSNRYAVNLKDKKGITVAHLAAQNPVLDYLIVLQQAGANLNEPDNIDGFTPMMMACSKNINPEVIKFFLNNGISVHQQTSDGMNLAHFAAYNSNPQIIQNLISHGVFFDREENSTLETPLHIAARRGCPEVCKVLLDNGSRLEARDIYNYTPILKSTMNPDPDVFKLLYKSGANLKAKGCLKNDIVHLALANSSFELFKDIIALTNTKFDNSNFEHYSKHIVYQKYISDKWNAMGIPFNRGQNKKLPYVICAAINPDIRVLNYLSEKGCNIYVGDFYENPVAYALARNPNPNMVNYLLRDKIERNAYEMVFANICKNPFPEVWNRVFELGFPYEYQDEQGTSLLMNVFKVNKNPNPEIVALLSDEKTVNLKDSLGLTACHYAAQKEDVIYLEILRMRGANLNEKENYQGTTPLMAACAINPNPAVIDYLVKNGADINERGLQGKDALLYSANNPNPKIALFLIKELKANIHTKNREGSNLLMEAIKANSFELVESLIKLGIDVNEKDNYGNPAIAISAYYSPSIEIFELLLKNGADINFKTDKNENLFIIAARNNSNEKIIEYFLNKGFSINYATSDGETPLLAAAMNSNWLVLDTLIKRGANLKDVDDNKQNVLMIASTFNDKPYIIKYLIDKGVPINYCDKDENTAVSGAAMNPNVNFIKMLVENGADLNFVNSIGSNALMIAASRQENVEVIKYLIENGLDVNATNVNGASALMFAAGNNPNPQVVELLITAGADVFAEDNNGDNAYKIAKEHNPNPAVAEKIKKLMMSASSYSASSFYNPSSKDIN